MLYIFRQSFTLQYHRLASNLLSPRLYLLNAGTIRVCHHTWHGFSALRPVLRQNTCSQVKIPSVFGHLVPRQWQWWGGEGPAGGSGPLGGETWKDRSTLLLTWTLCVPTSGAMWPDPSQSYYFRLTPFLPPHVSTTILPTILPSHHPGLYSSKPWGKTNLSSFQFLIPGILS